MAMLQANRQILPVLAGIFFLVPAVLLSALMPDVPPDLEGEAAAQAALDIFASWWPLVLASTLTQATGMLAIAVLLADNARPTVKEAISRAVRALPAYIGATLVLVAGLGLCALLILVPVTLVAGQGGAALAIVPIIAAALWVNIRTLTLVPVLAAEREGNPLEALRRTWAMTAGRGARLLFFAMLFVLAAMVISIVTTVVPGSLLIATLGQETGRGIVGIIEGFVGAALMMVWTALIVAIYRQIRGPAETA